MKDKDIRLVQYIEADLASVNRALNELGNMSISTSSATYALLATRHKLRQELMQAYFDEYAQGYCLDGTIILKPKNGR